MPGSEIVRFWECYSLDESKATATAIVRLGRDEEAMVELFYHAHGRYATFKGLPEHLGDSGIMSVHIQQELGLTAITVPEGYYPAHNIQELARARRQKQVLVEFAIGARQELWPGAYVEYSDEACDPTSRAYAVTRFARTM